MTKEQFMQDPLGNAKALTGRTKNCLKVQRLIDMVSDPDVPDEAIIGLTSSSDWRFMERRAMKKDYETGKTSLSPYPRYHYCNNWDRIAANGSGYGWTYVYAYAILKCDVHLM